MRKTITGTGGMLLIQTLKDAGVEYLFTNPGSAETGIFAALLEDGDQKLVVGKHEGLVAAMAEARCPVLMFGDDVWREGAQAEAVALAETLEAPVFNTRQIFVNFPSRHPLFCGMYPVSKDFEKVTGLKPDLIFLVGCQGVHGGVAEPTIMQIGPNPLLMGRHYPLDGAVQCELRETLRLVTEALKRSGDRGAGAARQRAKVRAFARLLIEREENLVSEHEHDPGVHASVLEVQVAHVLS